MPDDTPRLVTALGEHPRRRGRFVVEISGEPIATITADSIAELELRVGRGVTERTLDALRVHDARTTLMDRALRLLAVRGRSTVEISRALTRARERPRPEDVHWVVQTLTERGYLDDARFADQFVRDRAAARGWARQRMRQELRRRGVKAADTDAAFETASEDAVVDDEAAAQAAAAKWRRTHTSRDPERDRQRLYGFLARRGFDPDVIRAAMRMALRDGEGDVPS
jgi:regulatory protein